MKITKSRLKEIIKEEIAALSEKAEETVSDEISAQVKKGKPEDQAVAIALSKRDRGEIKEEEDPDMDFEKDEAHLDGVRDGSSGADRAGGYGMFQRFYDRGYDLGAKKSQEDALVFRDPPDIKRMKQGLKRISRPRSAGDFRSDKERFKKP